MLTLILGQRQDTTGRNISVYQYHNWKLTRSEEKDR